MSPVQNNAVGPQVRAPQPKPGLLVPLLACASFVGDCTPSAARAEGVAEGPYQPLDERRLGRFPLS
jgi:hypothetical protein